MFTARDVSRARLEQFIEARAMSGNVTRHALGISYKRAVPPSEPMSESLDIAISPGLNPGEIFLTVDEFPKPAAPPLPIGEAKAALARDQLRAE